MYIKHCKLSRNKQLELIKYFIAGSTARTAADLAGIHRNSAVRFFHKLREKIALKQQYRSEQFCGDIELDESYFGGVRKGKRGRGAAGKVVVFGILKRHGKVYTQLVHDTKSDTLMPIIRQKIMPDSVHRFLSRLQRARCFRVSSPSHQSLNPLCRAKMEPHQRHREFLESGKEALAQI